MADYKRWYDYDPQLKEVIELLRHYQDDFRDQASIFLDKIEAQVSKESVDKFYEMVKPAKGNRWYDHDPVLSKTIELLRVVPPEIQKQAAQNFISSMEQMGLDINVIKKSTT